MTMWNGENRRASDDDHDLLVSMHTLLMGMKETHERHIQDDERHFGRLYKGQNRLFWFVGIGTGILAAVKFLAKN